MAKIKHEGRKLRCRFGAGRSQQGTYAVEFALVFPLLFLVIYGMLTLGLIMTAKQSLTYAAEAGVRAALTAPVGFDVAQNDAAQRALRLQHRQQQAEQTARAHVRWLTDWVGAQYVQVLTRHEENQILLTVAYQYGQSPLVPVLGPQGLFAMILPQRLQAEAGIDLYAAGELGAGS